MSDLEEKRENLQQKKKNNYKIEIKQKNANAKKRKVKTWSSQEDQQLVRLYDEHPKKWGVISSLMKDRNQNQCLHRYRRLSHLGAQKKIWSSQQDQTVMSLIKKIGKNWKLLSEILGTKTGKQIRERFINKLDPKIKNEEWSVEQDRLILRFYSQFGSKWSQISKRLPGRPQNKIKNRFYSYIQKNYEVRYVQISKTEVPNLMSPENSLQVQQLEALPLGRYKLNPQPEKEQQVFQENQKKNISIPSFKQISANEGGKNQLYEEDPQASNKYGLQSLIRVDQELPIISESRYRSVRSLGSNNEIEHQNDLFYLLHQ